MKIKNLLLPALIILATGSWSFAQEVKIHKQIFGSPGSEMMLPTFDFITANGFVDAKTVKGAPFAAEFSSESVQTLADGNRLVKRSNSSLYRDAEGRTRREQAFAGINSATALLTGFNAETRQIFIYDPVAKTNYTLNPLTLTAFRSKVFMVTVDGKNTHNSAKIKTLSGMAEWANDPEVKKRFEKVEKEFQIVVKDLEKRPPMEKPREEALGTKTIEGIEAEGKRVTRIIPVGSIGNEKPIEIVRETWYSKELQMTVMSVDKNPLTGEHIYKMISCSRAEQPGTLFEVPSDYKIVDNSNMLNHLYKFEPLKSGATINILKGTPAEK